MARTTDVRREWLEKDYYEVLGVPRTATDKEIKRAYRKLAQQYHPDNNPGDTAAETRFKEVSEAHAVLSSESQRGEYDEARDAFSRGAYAGGPGGSQQYVRVENLGDLGDLFGGSGFGGLGDLFGRGARRPQAGGDIEAEISLSFHEAVAGVTRTLSLQGREIPVKVPAGINDGARIRLRGKGRPGVDGGPPGDLYVRVHAASHPMFDRKGRDLKIEVPITFSEATLGADLTVPTLDGKVTLKIPAGTASGRTFKVSGKGVVTEAGAGDLLVTVRVEVPTKLTDRAREIVEELRDLHDGRDARSHLGV